MSEYLIGVDNGGTVIKAVLFDLSGHELAVASCRTESISPQPGYVERDMEELWRQNCRCLKDLLEKSGISPRNIIGLAVCGHGKGLYPWGKDGLPAYRGIASTDNRAVQYPEKWKRDGTAQKLYPQLCQKLIPCQQASLLAWLKDNERPAYNNIQWVFSVKDYIRFRLTGEAFCEVTDVSGSGLMDVKNARVDHDLLNALGIGEVYGKLAPLRNSFDCCGYISPEASVLTGLQQGTPVAGGMFDIDACAVAMDIHSPEQVCTIAGTWSINEFISHQPILDTQIAMNSLYAVPGYYLLEECSATSAGNLEWVIRTFMNTGEQSTTEGFYDRINKMVASIDPAKCEVYFLPYLYGSNVHPLAKGSFIGLTTYHEMGHLLRAVYEGVAFSHKTHIERLLSAREAPRAIRMAGGATNSPLWVQLFADVLGYPIETVSGVTELGALGGAMAAAVSVGVFASYTKAAKAMVRVNEPINPDPGKTSIYARKYDTFTAISQALNPIWENFAE